MLARAFNSFANKSSLAHVCPASWVLAYKNNFIAVIANKQNLI